MTIQATELLKLFTKIEKLRWSVNVREDKDGDYVVHIYEMFRPEEFDEKVIITPKGESNWDKGYHSFDSMMDVLDEKLEKQLQRQELIARLTDEEKELLDLK